MYKDLVIIVAMISFGLLSAQLFISAVSNIWKRDIASAFRFGWMFFVALGAISILHYLGENAYEAFGTRGGWGSLQTWVLILPFALALGLFIADGVTNVIRRTASVRSMFSFSRTQRQIESLDQAPASGDNSKLTR